MSERGSFVNESIESLVSWHRRLKMLAQSQNIEWLISNDSDAHRDGYNDGNSPEDELNDQIYTAQTDGSW